MRDWVSRTSRFVLLTRLTNQISNNDITNTYWLSSLPISSDSRYDARSTKWCNKWLEAWTVSACSSRLPPIITISLGDQLLISTSWKHATPTSRTEWFRLYAGFQGCAEVTHRRRNDDRNEPLGSKVSVVKIKPILVVCCTRLHFQ